MVVARRVKVEVADEDGCVGGCQGGRRDLQLSRAHRRAVQRLEVRGGHRQEELSVEAEVRGQQRATHTSSDECG